MATCARTVLKVLSGCQRQLLTAGCPAHTGVSQGAPWHLPVRTLAAAAAAKPVRTFKKKEEKEQTKKKVKRADDRDPRKPGGSKALAPVDDVYVVRFYPRDVYQAADAIELLKSFQQLDFSALDQPVFIELRLDMTLEKKKKVDPFVSMINLPHPFKTEVNKVAVFTEDPDQVAVALENGAAFAGGADLIQQILDDAVEADFFVAVPDILAKLPPLKNKLRKRFPKNKRGSVGLNIPKMIATFRTGHEYLVERDCYVNTRVGSLDMPKEHLIANIQAIVVDVCAHRPASFGPFIERAILSSQSSEALYFRSEDLLPQQTEEKDE